MALHRKGIASGNGCINVAMACSRQTAMRSAVLWIDDRKSLSAVDGLVLDLQSQLSLDQLTEGVVLRRIVRIDAEQELLIVSIEKDCLPRVVACGRTARCSRRSSM
jgi:hypothetical protein